MKNKSLKKTAIIIAIGLIVAIAVHFFTSIQQKPTVTENDFKYSITYKLDGEVKTLEGIYTSRFVGFGNNGISPLDRNYDGEYTVDGVTTPSHTYTIAKNGTVELYIVNLLNDSYLMGDTENFDYQASLDTPFLEAVDEEGYAYDSDERDLLAMFDAEIISWDYPEPIENSFVFAGFSGLHPTSVLAMMVVGLFTLILCMILIKKEEGVAYNALDTIGILLNFAGALVVLPVISFAAYLIQAFQMGPEWIYQVYLCIPPVILFTLAASLSLRRKGFRISGFLIQFFGPAILVIFGILENIL